MAPLPATRIIPAGWSRHHARAIPTSMNATVTIGLPSGEAQYDPETDDTTQAFDEKYNGPARIQALNDSQREEAAGQNISGRAYLVQLDMLLATNDINPGMRVRVLTAPNDAQLVGQDLWVVDPQLGSERFTRDVVCSDNQSDAVSA